MNKKVLVGVIALVIVVALVIFIVALSGMINLSSQSLGDSTLENKLPGHSFVIQRDLTAAQPILKVLSDAGINTYNIVTTVEPLTINEGFFATAQIIGHNEKNLSGVDVTVNDDEKEILLTIYINNDIFKEEADILTHVNKNYFSGLQYAALIKTGRLSSTEARENTAQIINSLFEQIGDNYLITYE